MQLRNKILTIKGQSYYCLAGINLVECANRSVWLFNSSIEENEKPVYSLWNVEYINEDKIDLWPYEGINKEALIKKLLEDFLENAYKEEEE